jgi:hypothetical protein
LAEKLKRGSWLRIGDVYDVLEVHAGEDGRNLLRLVGRQSTPALFHVRAFTILDGRFPSTWTISSSEDAFVLGPEPWREAGFWDRFFDREPEAVRIYEVECWKMGIALGAQASRVQAFEAFRDVLFAVGNHELSTDLLTVSLGMDYLHGHRADPAYEDEWAERWGDAESLPFDGAFAAAMRFLQFEVSWSDEPVVLRLLSGGGEDWTRLRSLFREKLKRHHEP